MPPGRPTERQHRIRIAQLAESGYWGKVLAYIRSDPTGKLSKAKEKRNSSRRKFLAKSPSHRIRNAMAARIWAALCGRSDRALFSRLPYTQEELTRHLEALFIEGMAWSNYGAWHVDHKKPCKSFDLTDPEQFNECWALSNLQPLWAADNVKKGAKYASA